MDRSRMLTLGGAGLLATSALAFAFVVFGGGEDAPPPLPDEVASAPLAPSQAPDVRREPPATVPRPDGNDGSSSSDEAVLPSDGSDGAPNEEDGPAGEAVPSVTDRDRSAKAGGERRAIRPPGPSAAALALCFPGVIPTPDGCASRATILSFAGEPIGVEGQDGAVQPLTVTLADPGDLAAPEREVGTCDDYLALKGRGWSALTSASMDRDLRMNRFCGLIAMARRAERPTRGGLARLTYGGLETVPPADWPSLGEAAFDAPTIALDADDDRLWRVEGEGLSLSLRDVGAADFDGDGRSEVLVHAGVAARGGTARGGGYLLAEGESGGQVRLSPANLYGRD